MTEIERLRTRLKNVQKNVVEYTMTVKEARALLKEIDDLGKAKATVIEKVVPKLPEEPKQVIWDGGQL